MGVKIDDSIEFQNYRKSVHDIGELFLHRTFRPWLYNDSIYGLMPDGRKFSKALNVAHSFTKNVVDTKREVFSRSIVEDYQNNDNEENM